MLGRTPAQLTALENQLTSNNSFIVENTPAEIDAALSQQLTALRQAYTTTLSEITALKKTIEAKPIPTDAEQQSLATSIKKTTDLINEQKKLIDSIVAVSPENILKHNAVNKIDASLQQQQTDAEKKLNENNKSLSELAIFFKEKNTALHEDIQRNQNQFNDAVAAIETAKRALLNARNVLAPSSPNIGSKQPHHADTLKTIDSLLTAKENSIKEFIKLTNQVQLLIENAKKEKSDLETQPQLQAKKLLSTRIITLKQAITATNGVAGTEDLNKKLVLHVKELSDFSEKLVNNARHFSGLTVEAILAQSPSFAESTKTLAETDKAIYGPLKDQLNLIEKTIRNQVTDIKNKISDPTSNITLESELFQPLLKHSKLISEKLSTKQINFDAIENALKNLRLSSDTIIVTTNNIEAINKKITSLQNLTPSDASLDLIDKLENHRALLTNNQLSLIAATLKNFSDIQLDQKDRDVNNVIDSLIFEKENKEANTFIKEADEFIANNNKKLEQTELLVTINNHIKEIEIITSNAKNIIEKIIAGDKKADLENELKKLEGNLRALKKDATAKPIQLSLVKDSASLLESVKHFQTKTTKAQKDDDENLPPSEKFKRAKENLDKKVQEITNKLTNTKAVIDSIPGGEETRATKEKLTKQHNAFNKQLLSLTTEQNELKNETNVTAELQAKLDKAIASADTLTQQVTNEHAKNVETSKANEEQKIAARTASILGGDQTYIAIYDSLAAHETALEFWQKRIAGAVISSTLRKRLSAAEKDSIETKTRELEQYLTFFKNYANSNKHSDAIKHYPLDTQKLQQLEYMLANINKIKADLPLLNKPQEFVMAGGVAEPKYYSNSDDAKAAIKAYVEAAPADGGHYGIQADRIKIEAGKEILVRNHSITISGDDPQTVNYCSMVHREGGNLRMSFHFKPGHLQILESAPNIGSFLGPQIPSKEMLLAVRKHILDLRSDPTFPHDEPLSIFPPMGPKRTMATLLVLKTMGLKVNPDCLKSISPNKISPAQIELCISILKKEGIYDTKQVQELETTQEKAMDEIKSAYESDKGNSPLDQTQSLSSSTASTDSDEEENLSTPLSPRR